MVYFFAVVLAILCLRLKQFKIFMIVVDICGFDISTKKWILIVAM